MESEYISNIIKKDGYSKYAYVTLVINNNIYASPAIIMAESIRKYGNLGDLIVFIDEIIDMSTIELLKKFYDKIIKIEKIKIEHKDNVQQIILTKIQCYNLIEYEKIFIIDSDTIFFKNIDNNFNLNVPSCLKIENQNNYGILMIKPSKKIYNKILEIIKNNRNKLTKEKKPFNFIIGILYGNKINKLDIELGINKYQNNNDGIQYSIDKPFLMTSDKTIEQRIKLDHFKIWFNYLINIINNYPELEKIKCLEEPINISKYFLATLSRFIVNNRKISRNNKYDIVKEIYGKDIKENNLDFYHIDKSKEYSSENLNYDINNFSDFLNFIKLNTFIDIKNIDSKNIKELIININNEKKLLYYVLGNYIKIFQNVFIALKISLNSEEKNDDIEELKNNLLYKQEYQINGLVLKNIIFNIYQNYTYTQRINSLVSLEDNQIYLINIEIYQTLYPIDILDKNYMNKVYILIEPNTKIRFVSIFFNLNTFEKFNNNNISWINTIEKNNFIDRKSIEKILYFQTLKKWLYNNYNANTMNNIIIMKQKNKKLVILDNNKYNLAEIKRLNQIKINYIDLIFLKSSQYIKIIEKNKYTDNYIYNINNYMEIEGIKFYSNNSF